MSDTNMSTDSLDKVKDTENMDDNSLVEIDVDKLTSDEAEDEMGDKDTDGTDEDDDIEADDTDDDDDMDDNDMDDNDMDDNDTDDGDADDKDDDDKEKDDTDEDNNIKTIASMLSNQEKTSDKDNTDTDTDEEDEDHFKKFDSDVQADYFKEKHPESIAHSHDEVERLAIIKRDKHGAINDPYHRTLPFMSRYEITNILGIRAKQLNNGAAAFITPPNNIFDGYQIARLELQRKKLPFIIKRPIPGGKCEYWRVHDLEILRDI